MGYYVNEKQNNEVLLEVKDVKKYYSDNSGFLSKKSNNIKAVDGVSFKLRRGETFGLVGESGCGKSTLGRLILKLTPATSGEVIFEGKNVFSLPKNELRRLRRDMQMIFQDPYSSLNPRMKVEDIIGEPMSFHGIATGKEKKVRVQELLELVGLRSSDITRYPHEFSGGQRQRIGIARALSLNPKLIVCDEAVSALDVSVQSQILNLLDDLKEKLGLTYIFIAHGLDVVKHISDYVGVMYLGKLVEVAPADELFLNPIHPYTRALMSAIPIPNPEVNKERIILEGDIPSPANPPSGCHFHTRCKHALPECSLSEPVLKPFGKERLVACHVNF